MLGAHEHKSLLRFLLCGSVDDGKSTLIRRLLSETQALYADQLAALEVDSRTSGTQGEELDFAPLTDCLAADRERGITIDVAYRHFSTEHRQFIVADTPGHEQYTRTMVTGASTADCAVILIDASKGVLRQARRHSYLCALLGIRHLLVAVNKMDQVEFAQARFAEIERDYGELAQRIELTDFTCIPVSALRGDNVHERSRHTPWYDGPTLMEYLEGVEVEHTPIDLSPGDVIAQREQPAQLADLLQATIVWMHEQPMLRGRTYLMRIGERTLPATVAPLKYKLNIDSFEHVAASKLELNEIGVCDLELSAPVAFDHYVENRDTGGFILIDRITNDTVGVGLIQFALRRSQSIRWQPLTVDRAARAEAMGQTPCVLWFTGLSGAGKSTIADHVEAELHQCGQHTYLLDGDNIRHGLSRDLGFTDADRVENIRRVAEVAKLMVDAGLIVIVSFISPFRSEREMARALFDDGQFVEVFVDTPLAVAEDRDPKGLYKKARRGELQHFTGIDSPYEPPQRAEIRIQTTAMTPEQAASRVIAFLEGSGLLATA